MGAALGQPTNPFQVIHAHCSRFLNHDVYQDQYHSVLSQHSPMGGSMSAGEFMQKMTDEARFGLGKYLDWDHQRPRSRVKGGFHEPDLASTARRASGETGHMTTGRPDE